MNKPKMLNNYLQCEDLSLNKQETSSGFETKKQERFKILKVLLSNEEDVVEGDLVKVSINAGEKDIDEENKVIIRRGDIIQIL